MKRKSGKESDPVVDLQKAMEEMYFRAGREVGYWGHYFLRSVRNNGGLATAKRMLQPVPQGNIQKGFQALLDAGRPDLSLEALVLKKPFNKLFSRVELNEARRRLKLVPKHAFRKRIRPERNFPDDLPTGRQYAEGAVKRVVVNAFERNGRARKACISKHGFQCAVCEMSFEERYGEIGKKFIHVHHKKPLAAMRKQYRINPVKDLVPVCPNCHAMLHTSDPPLSIEELHRMLRDHTG